MTLVSVLLLIALYWTPTIVATIRKGPNTRAVVVINFLLGWTVIGWIAALVMACRTPRVPG
jgi:hypothetical protein